MNQTEHILTVLSEEGVEVAQAIAHATLKALRFGLMDQLTLDPRL